MTKRNDAHATTDHTALIANLRALLKEPWHDRHPSDVDTALILAADALAAKGWQPIETAPKDGTWVLLWWPYWHHEPQAGFYRYQWHCHVAASNEGPAPLYWQPLPSPPTEEGVTCEP